MARPNRQTRVYPRVCGGTWPSLKRGRTLPGLSPRVRGNRRRFLRRGEKRRSIPACAGEPRRRWSTCRRGRVYPRVCGGTVCRASRRASIWGLSPRVRGNPMIGREKCHWHRSIPACAGEPPERDSESTRIGVYPRVCGGTPGTDERNRPPWGLSPRVRGNRGGAPRRPGGAGSIPACAGEPVASPNRNAGDGVYPRVCGGTSGSRFIWRLTAGLSPRVRGNLEVDMTVSAPTRSIPACAGEPL